jgi:hypothetical protein
MQRNGPKLILITLRTLLKPGIKTQSCPKIIATAKPRNGLFWLLKHVFLLKNHLNPIT